MKFNYDGKSNKSGVYKITNLTNGKVYIGSAKRFKTRGQQHINSLEKGVHQNRHLQSAFNRDGTDVFVFEVLEVVLGDKLVRTTVEQTYLDQYLDDWERCYNFQKQTVAKERSCFSKNPEETRRKMSESMKRIGNKPPVRWGPMPEEQRRKISKALTGKKLSKEHIQALSESHQGQVVTEEQKMKISMSMKAHFAQHGHHMVGRKRSEETKAKLSRINSGKNHPQYGKPKSKETRKKISEAKRKKRDEG